MNQDYFDYLIPITGAIYSQHQKCVELNWIVVDTQQKAKIKEVQRYIKKSNFVPDKQFLESTLLINEEEYTKKATNLAICLKEIKNFFDIEVFKKKKKAAFVIIDEKLLKITLPEYADEQFYDFEFFYKCFYDIRIEFKQCFTVNFETLNEMWDYFSFKQIRNQTYAKMQCFQIAKILVLILKSGYKLKNLIGGFFQEQYVEKPSIEEQLLGEDLFTCDTKAKNGPTNTSNLPSIKEEDKPKVNSSKQNLFKESSLNKGNSPPKEITQKDLLAQVNSTYTQQDNISKGNPQLSLTSSQIDFKSNENNNNDNNILIEFQKNLRSTTPSIQDPLGQDLQSTTLKKVVGNLQENLIQPQPQMLSQSKQFSHPPQSVESELLSQQQLFQPQIQKISATQIQQYSSQSPIRQQPQLFVPLSQNQGMQGNQQLQQTQFSRNIQSSPTYPQQSSGEHQFQQQQQLIQQEISSFQLQHPLSQQSSQQQVQTVGQLIQQKQQAAAAAAASNYSKPLSQLQTAPNLQQEYSKMVGQDQVLGQQIQQPPQIQQQLQQLQQQLSQQQSIQLYQSQSKGTSSSNNLSQESLVRQNQSEFQNTGSQSQQRTERSGQLDKQLLRQLYGIVKLRGFPSKCSDQDIQEYLKYFKVVPNGIIRLTDSGKVTSECLAILENKQVVYELIDYTKTHKMQNKDIDVFQQTPSDYFQFESSNFDVNIYKFGRNKHSSIGSKEKQFNQGQTQIGFGTKQFLSTTGADQSSLQQFQPQQPPQQPQPQQQQQQVQQQPQITSENSDDNKSSTSSERSKQDQQSKDYSNRNRGGSKDKSKDYKQDQGKEYDKEYFSKEYDKDYYPKDYNKDYYSKEYNSKDYGKNYQKEYYKRQGNSKEYSHKDYYRDNRRDYQGGKDYNREHFRDYYNKDYQYEHGHDHQKNYYKDYSKDNKDYHKDYNNKDQYKDYNSKDQYRDSNKDQYKEKDPPKRNYHRFDVNNSRFDKRDDRFNKLDKKPFQQSGSKHSSRSNRRSRSRNSPSNINNNLNNSNNTNTNANSNNNGQSSIDY